MIKNPSTSVFQVAPVDKGQPTPVTQPAQNYRVCNATPSWSLSLLTNLKP